jgi:excisionase family DNA binding protein
VTLAVAAEPCQSAVLTLPETAELLRIDPGELERLAQRRELPARRIGDAWRFGCAAVMAWLNGDPGAADAADSPDFRRSLSPQEMSSVTAAGTPAVGQAEPASDAENDVTDLDAEPIGEAPDGRTAEDVLLREQRVLVGSRDLSLNWGQFYSETDSLVFASSEEGDVLAVVEQAALLTTFQARIGIGEELEMFVGASYANQDSELRLGSQKLASSGLSEFGDVLFGFRRTLVRERVGRPNVIGTLTAHIPTGTSSYAIAGGLGFVKSFDPVALFASVHYTRTLSEDFPDITRLEPEHRLDTNLGFALALNDTHSLRGSVAAAFTGATRFPNAALRQQDAYSLGFGLTSRVSQALYLEPSVSFGLGGVADGFAFGVSIFTFTP